MVSRRKRPGKGTGVKFAEPPWNQIHPDWIRLDEQLPDDHLARTMVEAVQLLDLTSLYASYTGRGSPPIRPDLMLAMVLLHNHPASDNPVVVSLQFIDLFTDPRLDRR